MPDIQKVVQTKERILSVIRNKGPTYPARIARDAELSPLFTAAFLSELVSDRKLKISNMKVGSSPIYYIEGQESLLESFSEYLNPKEKEAFEKLKNQELLNDEDQEPAIRVALRKIKDFAIPINVRIDGETKLFWRYYQIKEEEIREKIRLLLNPIQTEQKTKILEPEKVEEPPIKLETNIANNETETEEKEKQPIIKPKQNPSNFAEQIKEYLSAKDIEVLEELSIKKKEFIAKIRTDTLFGKQEYFLTAKDKKKVTQDDLTIATQKAHSERMPALFIAPGTLDKNASSYLEDWKNIIRYEKIKL